MAKLISALILGAVCIPAAIGLFILFRNEIHVEREKTAGLGMPVIFGMLLIFVVMPIIIFLTS